ncbi:hypothetical protein ACLB2K_058745 [Fragaria x ananassa]
MAVAVEDFAIYDSGYAWDPRVFLGLHGDVVLLLLPNSVYYPIVFLGALYIGAIITTINLLSSVVEIKKQIKGCNACFGFNGCENVDKLQALSIPAIAVSGNDVLDSKKEVFLDFYQLVNSEGVSKGVLITHANLIAKVELFMDLTPLNFTNLLNNSKLALDDLNEPLNAYDFPLSQCHLNDSPYGEICSTEFCATEEQQPPCEPSSKKAAAPRQANFSIEEGKLLVSAWLNISLDLVKGTGQKKQQFWKRITKYFEDNKTWTGERSTKSLINRWSTISSSVSKFCGHYSSIEHLRRSGYTYKIRPIGRKAAKEAKSNDDGGTNEKESRIRSELEEFRAKRLEIDRIKAEQFKLLLDTQKKEVALKEKELDLQARSEEIGIMSMDTSKMLPHQVEYFIGLQKEILAKRAANGNE